MKYTIKQLATMAGISVRTLHYYDEIGLLKPSTIHINGYRYYGEKELMTLQQILFFRELDFSLEKIKRIMQSPQYNHIAALEDQKKFLELKKDRVDRMITTITNTINTMKGGEDMSNNDKFSAFSDPTYQKYIDEVEQRWGNTNAYKQSMERVGKMSKADLEKVKAEAGDITSQIALLMTEGYAAESTEVQEQIDRFYQHLHHFYDPNYEMFRGLGQMYVDDPRFTATYEKIAPGLAEFKRDAMAFYADAHVK
jgi:DNA-binding transcriptional MerR regulator